MSRKKLLRLLNIRSLVMPGALLLCLGFSAGCQSSRGSFTDLAGSKVQVPPPNLLMEGDTISVTFQYSTNFNSIQKIGMDGSINLESVGQVKAAGKTPLQLQEQTARLYQPQIKDDVVTVRVVAAASSIYVSGAVLRPGKIPFDRPMTVLEGIMEAGGFDPNRAKLSSVRVIRLEHGQQRIYYLNLQDVLQSGAENPFFLKAFDIVHVPLKTFNF